jgi:hypothetical protein
VLQLLITLLVVCLVIGLIWYVLDALPVPDPLNRIAKIVAMVIGCIIIIMLLLNVAGVDTGLGRLR